jgi:hypothetical protein
MEATSIAAAEELTGRPAIVAGTARLGVPEVLVERVLWLAAPVDMFARRRFRVVWDFLRGVVAAEPELFGPAPNR